MVAQSAYSGTFDGALSPRVEICELVANACGSMLATYTTATGPGSETVRLMAASENYQVNWHAHDFNLGTTRLYRVSVRAGSHNVLLGYADVQPVSNGSAVKNV